MLFHNLEKGFKEGTMEPFFLKEQILQYAWKVEASSSLTTSPSIQLIEMCWIWTSRHVIEMCWIWTSRHARFYSRSRPTLIIYISRIFQNAEGNLERENPLPA